VALLLFYFILNISFNFRLFIHCAPGVRRAARRVGSLAILFYFILFMLFYVTFTMRIRGS
jgi:hypothetical protein